MLPGDLARMSTQIAQFFAPYPESAAVDGVEDHLLKFWDPRMRAELITIRHLGAPALHPLVEGAVDRIIAREAP